jgi:hypothetical protein
MMRSSKGMSVDWQTAAERLNRFAHMDSSLRRELNNLSMAEARDDKLASKLEGGRIYGLQQEYYGNKLRRDLARSLRREDVTEEHWAS